MKRLHVAAIFPGQGAQQVGMAADLYDAFPMVRDLFAEADDALGFPLSRIIREGPEAALRQTANTQPAILLTSIAIYGALGLQPAVVAGHSLGEYSALVAAGALRFRDAVVLVNRRGQYMQEAVPEGTGCMLALVGVTAETVMQVIASTDGAVNIANHNAPGQIVIAGARDATRAVAKRTEARQIVELAVSAPFHCQLMRPAEERLSADLERIPFANLEIPLYSNVDARRITTAHEARDGLKRQVSRTVRWVELTEKIIGEEGIRTFVEIGPGNVLSGLLRRIDRSTERLAVNDRTTLESVRAKLVG